MGLGAQEMISYLCIFANGLSKMPQIKRVHKTQSVAGLSVTSILLELYCHGMLSGFHGGGLPVCSIPGVSPPGPTELLAPVSLGLGHLLPPPANLRNHLLLHRHRLHGRWRCPQVSHANCHERQHPTWPELKGRSNPIDPKRGNERQRGGNGLGHKRRHWNDAAVHTSQLEGATRAACPDQLLCDDRRQPCSLCHHLHFQGEEVKGCLTRVHLNG